MNGLILLSGGIDSVTCLYEYKDDISTAIYFDYGSRQSKQERDIVIRHCKALKKDIIIFPLSLSKFTNNVLYTDQSVNRYRNFQDTFVPFRNVIFISIASSIAIARGLDTVFIGTFDGTDKFSGSSTMNFSDATMEFNSAMNNVLKIASENKLKLLAPFENLTKRDVVLIGLKHLKSNLFSETYTCYTGNKKHCGYCIPCVERHNTFRYLGIEDKTDYEKEEKDGI